MMIARNFFMQEPGTQRFDIQTKWPVMATINQSKPMQTSHKEQ